MNFPTIEEFKKTDYSKRSLNKELESILDLLIWSKANLRSNFIFVSSLSKEAKKIIEDKGYKVEKIKEQYKITY